MRYLVAIAALLTAAPSTSVETGPGTPYFDGMPPARYDGNVAAIVVMVDDVAPYCGPPPPEGLQIVACARRLKDGSPIIFAPNPRPYAEAGDRYAQIMLHEGAHVAGWSGNHEE